MRGCKRPIRKNRLLEDLKDTTQKIKDSQGKRTSECMVVLVSALEVGAADIDRLVDLTGYPRDFIETVSRRMRQAGLWVGNSVDDREWWDQDGNLTSGLFAHALIAQGQYIRERTGGGGCLYVDPETGEVVREWSPPVATGTA